MGIKEAEQVLCPHPLNATCSKKYESITVSIILYIVFITGIFLATFGNLVVILSIAHFKQLHTPTNVLIFSMAVTDFIIGIFVMPVYLIKEMHTCWQIKASICMASIFCYTTISSISVAHLIFLSLDRYYAVCYPLLYSTKVTNRTALVFVAVSWICPSCYSVLMNYLLITFLYGKENFVFGFYEFVTYITLSLADMVFTFMLPFFIMLFLYSKILKVALQHVRALRRIKDDADIVQKNKKGFNGRTNKATITISIVIGTFFSFSSQFYIFQFIAAFIEASFLIRDIIEHLALFNFALNPVIYGLFYPWFRKGLKLIVTCKIFKVDSSLSNLFPENN